MVVERRYSKRLLVALEARISYRHKRSFPAVATNLSLEGAFLRTRSLSIPTGSMVELECTAFGKVWTVAALVIHCNKEGIWVMFREPQRELYREIGEADSWRVQRKSGCADGSSRTPWIEV